MGCGRNFVWELEPSDVALGLMQAGRARQRCFGILQRTTTTVYIGLYAHIHT